MKLVEPSHEYFESFKIMADDYKNEGSIRYQFEQPLTPAFFTEYVRRIEAGKYIDATIGDLMPQWMYWMIDDSNEILGVSRFRPVLNQKLMNEGGSIGYDVPPSKRMKGYATLLLALTLDKARSAGLNRVLITCDKSNIASKKVIEKNGGIYERGAISDVTGKEVLRFWIDV